MTLPNSHIATYTNSPFFACRINYNSSKVTLQMDCLTSLYYTKAMPQTLPLLRQYLPSIFESTCFNDANLSFCDEVKDTEIAHLFEHILLEYLCQAKVKSGVEDAIYNGMTTWNWNKDPKGRFFITIDAGLKDIYRFYEAFQKSTGLLEMIFSKQKAAIH